MYNAIYTPLKLTKINVVIQFISEYLLYIMVPKSIPELFCCHGIVSVFDQKLTGLKLVEFTLVY